MSENDNPSGEMIREVSTAAICEALTKTWYEQIPLSAAMGVELVSFDNNLLKVGADLQPNINLHGTGFAGSLYAINALCGWSMVHLQLQVRRLDASIVLADGRINYARPVTGRILSVCDFGEQVSALDQLKSKGKARFTLTAAIAQSDEPNARPAATFEGDYAVFLGSE